MNRRVSVVAFFLMLAWSLAGCGSDPQEVAPSPGDGTYRVRGTIVALPSPKQPHLLVHHEAIPDFRNQRGEVVGMHSMTMPFPLAQGVELEGFATKDAVELTFEVRWNARRDRFRVLKVARVSEAQAPATAESLSAPRESGPEEHSRQ